MNESLNLEEAAAFLHLHTMTLLRRAQSGEIPGAKIGKRWVFLRLDLIEYVRSQYSQQASVGVTEGSEQCHSTNAKTRQIGGSSSLLKVRNQYNAVLELPTNS
ncbi:MAG: helix-turn-helix domain-containing protein [Methylophilaceae bacterium]